MCARSMRTVKENIYFTRSLTNLLSTHKYRSSSLGLNVLLYQKISNAVSTYENRYNKYDFIHKQSVFATNNIKFYSKKSDEVRNVMNFYEFAEVENKEKQTFTQMISMYEEKFPSRKGVVDFIYSALKNMKDFGVHEDLETYKRLINLMPQGKFVPSNLFQSEGRYFPREQYCILDLLCQMESNGVIPDVDMNDMLIKIFGPLGMPTKKYYRMMYWLPKFKNLSPWPVPNPLPKETFTLAKLAIERITSVDLQTEISVYRMRNRSRMADDDLSVLRYSSNTYAKRRIDSFPTFRRLHTVAFFRTEDVEDSLDKTWIVSGQSPEQRRLLQKHNRLKPVIVEGGEHVWLRSERINYYVLKSEDFPYVWKPKDIGDVVNLPVKYLNMNYQDEEEEEERSVHEQEDGIIYAVCATGTSSQDSLLSWIRLLQKNGNPVLENLVVLFRFKTPPQKPVPFTDALVNEQENRKPS